MSSSDLDAALLNMTDKQIMDALARRTAAKEAQKRAVTLARVHRHRNAKCNDGVTQTVTPENRVTTSECNANGNASVTPSVTQNGSSVPLPSPSLTPPPSTPSPSALPLTPIPVPPVVPQPPDAAPSADGLEGAKRKKVNVTPTSAEAQALHALYGRRTTTEWSEKEIKAFKAAKPTMEDVELVCRYTRAERGKGNDGRHRRELATLLNNWNGEVDRARQWEDEPADVPLLHLNGTPRFDALGRPIR